MKEIPILFSTPMVQAIMDGRKTTTRRAIKPKDTPYLVRENSFVDWSESFGWAVKHKICDNPERFEITQHFKCPYGQPGDILWVREKWRKYYHVDEHGYTLFDKEIIEFSADDHEMILEKDGDGCHVFNKDGSEKFISWKPSIHMLKSDCRIWLKITNVRVERLHDITPGDSCDEGIEYWNIDGEAMEGGELQADFKNYTWTEKKEDDKNYEDRYFPTFANPVDSFRTLWQSINGPESWDSNPWVWVVEFKVLSTTGKPTEYSVSAIASPGEGAVAVDKTKEGLGTCKEKGCERIATRDYNGHGHYVCEQHYESLSNYFDEEYK